MYVAIFRNIPLIVQFFIWYLVIPELLPPSIGNWFKQLPPNAQFFSSSIICLGLFTGARVCEQVRSGIARCRADSAPRVSPWVSRNGRPTVTC